MHVERTHIHPFKAVEGLRTAHGEQASPVNVCLPYEHTLSISVNDQPYRTITCTPTQLEALLVGRLLTDGLISTMADIAAWTFTEDEAQAHVALAATHSPRPHPCSFLSPEAIDAMVRTAQEQLEGGHPLYKITRGVHSCTLLHRGKPLYVTEDMSRHNAFDKAVGRAVLDGIPLNESVLYVSSRIPEDMLRKGIKAGLPVIVGKGMPTYQSVLLARRHGIVLICDARNGEYVRFSPGESARNTEQFLQRP